MTQAENSVLGMAKQTAKGTPNPTDNAYKYFLYTMSNLGPASSFLPLDMEVGGGALPRGSRKVGVTSGGAMTFIPRPEILGDLFLGVTGSVASVGTDANADLTDDYYDHTFKLAADEFSAPYFTLRNSPGNLLGEQFQDVRVASLGMSWRGADFVRAQASFVGGLPTPSVSMTAWNSAAQVDSKAPFLAPIGDIELPTATDVKCLAGGFTAQNAISLDDQWIVGSYSPDDFDISARIYTLSLALKITDKVLYEKMMYDPAQGGAWAASILEEGNIKVLFKSDAEVYTGVPYQFQIAANGQSQASGNANIQWSVTPIGIRSGRSIILNATGQFIADPQGTLDPITITLKNATAAY